MKIFLKNSALAFLFFLMAVPLSIRAQDEAAPAPAPADGDDQDQDQDQDVSFQSFYDQLGDQGTWVQTDDYGYVWQPDVSDPDWRPYSDGQWAYSDEGWTWVSSEPWGWATYHYGRWANIDGTGWVWVPGYRWAPAWVSWRYGGGYCGWAPLPPETIRGAEYAERGAAVGVGFHFGGDVDVSFGIGAGCYNFVAIGDIGAPDCRRVMVDHANNYTIINRTTNITNINVNHRAEAGGAFRGVVVNGPPINEINASARNRVPTVQLTAMNRPGTARLQGNSLAVYAPRVNASSRAQAHPAHVSANLGQASFNRGDSISRPLAVTRTVMPRAASQDAVRAAETAQAQAPAQAKIAPAGHTAPATGQPFSALQPVNQSTANAPAVNTSSYHPVGAPTVETSRQTGNNFHEASTPQTERSSPAEEYRSHTTSPTYTTRPAMQNTRPNQGANPGANRSSGNQHAAPAPTVAPSGGGNPRPHG